MTHFLSGKKIVVAGAGLSGLSFAIGLRKTWDDASGAFPEVVIYERDAKQSIIDTDTHAISLGGTDEQGGLVACRDLGVLDGVLGQALLKGEEHKFSVWDAKFNSMFSASSKPFDGLPATSVRIKKRHALAILIAAAEATNTIHWGTAVASAAKIDGDRVRVQLSNGSSEECDLLIAADGAESKVRESLRPDDKLEYAGAVQFGGVSKCPDGIPAQISNAGLVISGSEVGCFFSPIEDGKVVWGLSKWDKSGPREGYDKTSNAAFQALVKEALDLGKPIAEPFAAIVKNTLQDASTIIPAKDKKPFKHDAALRGVVFLGDSNHTVSSFAGTGGNMALKDGINLAKSLSAGKSLDEAVAAYDAVSLPVAEKTYKDSRDRMAQSHYSGFKFTMFKGALKAGGAILSATGK